VIQARGALDDPAAGQHLEGVCVALADDLQLKSSRWRACRRILHQPRPAGHGCSSGTGSTAARRVAVDGAPGREFVGQVPPGAPGRLTYTIAFTITRRACTIGCPRHSHSDRDFYRASIVSRSALSASGTAGSRWPLACPRCSAYALRPPSSG